MRTIKGLYAITDSSLMPGEKLLPAVTAAMKGGAKIIQYRNKNASESQKLSECKQIKAICLKHQALLIVNDDIDLCIASDADGVHIGQSDIGISDARARLGKALIIGQTCHNSLSLANRAQSEGANYVAFGRFFTSKTKPHAPAANMDTLIQAKRELDIPIVAIGGITLDNAPVLINAGTDAIAVIHSLFADTDIEQTARTFATLFSR